MRTIVLTAVLASAMTVAFTPIPAAQASDGVCGWYAFAMATKNRRAANKAARKYGGQVYDVDESDSPNAGQGWWTVARGPGSKRWANQRRNEYRSRGASGAYVASRCMY